MGLRQGKGKESMKTSGKNLWKVGALLLVIAVLIGGGFAHSKESPAKLHGDIGPKRVTNLGTAINSFAAFLVKCTGNKGPKGSMHSISLKRQSEKGPGEVVQVVFACFPKPGKQTAKK